MLYYSSIKRYVYYIVTLEFPRPIYYKLFRILYCHCQLDQKSTKLLSVSYCDVMRSLHHFIVKRYSLVVLFYNSLLSLQNMFLCSDPKLCSHAQFYFLQSSSLFIILQFSEEE